MAASSLGLNNANTAPVGSDGYTHTTYAFIDSNGNAITPDVQTGSAFAAATSKWNAHKGTTGAQFDALPSGQDPSQADIQIRLSDDSTGQTGGCAKYSPQDGRIYYGQTFQAAANVGIATTIFSHELGHALGLDDAGTSPNPPSIMNNPSNGLPAGCTNPVVVTTTIQPTDAAAVPSCTKAAKAQIQQLLQKSKEKQTQTNNATSYTFGYCTWTYGYLDTYDSSFNLIDEETWLEGTTCTQ